MPKITFSLWNHRGRCTIRPKNSSFQYVIVSVSFLFLFALFFLTSWWMQFMFSPMSYHVFINSNYIHLPFGQLITPYLVGFGKRREWKLKLGKIVSLFCSCLVILVLCFFSYHGLYSGKISYRSKLMARLR